MSRLLDQFESMVEAFGKAGITRRGNTIYYVTPGVFLSEVVDDPGDVPEDDTIPYREGIPVYKVPPLFDPSPKGLLDPAAMFIGDTDSDTEVVTAEVYHKLAFAVGKFGRGAMALHMLEQINETEYRQLEEHGLADVGIESFADLGATIWLIPKLIMPRDEFVTLVPTLRRTLRSERSSMILEMHDDKYNMYIVMASVIMKPEDPRTRGVIYVGDKKYVADAWNDKPEFKRFMKWKEGRMELARPTTKAPVAKEEPAKAEPVVETPKVEAQPAVEAEPATVPEQPVPEVTVEKPAAKAEPKPEPKKKTRAAQKQINYEEITAALAQISDSLTPVEAKTTLRSLRDLQLAISRAMANISIQTIDAYEADAIKYQELKKIIK